MDPEETNVRLAYKFTAEYLNEYKSLSQKDAEMVCQKLLNALNDISHAHQISAIERATQH